jgi:hypothetical protein
MENNEVQEARARLASKFANTQIGGKGIIFTLSFSFSNNKHYSIGTQRRKKKHVN